MFSTPWKVLSFSARLGTTNAHIMCGKCTKRKEDIMETILIIILLIMLFGGGGFYWSRRGR